MLALILAIAGFAASQSVAAASKADPAAQLPAGALANASSLYLREAAAAPVRWQPWSRASMELARTLKRPLLIDIGAVWCHWCHVMDQTTYADPQVADLINTRFVPIKVDSDQRPDIDRYYQEAASSFDAGGWPLTCFATPDGAPFYIAGYLPARGTPNDPRGAGFPYVAGRIADAYASDSGLPKMAHEIAAKIAGAKRPAAVGHHGEAALRQEILASISTAYDRNAGGFGVGPGPRFYDFPALRLALVHGSFGHRDFTALALDSLRKIAAGGVYDQLGGGFHRYSTDPAWRVPHFEKMGYDQAMAIVTYVQAWQVSGDDQFARIARGTIGYVNATLLDPKTHTFYSHQDADAFPGDDGSYYTWTREEIERALTPPQSRVALAYFGFDDDPARAPDGRIVLRRAMSADEIAARLKIPKSQAAATLSQAVAAMESARERRRAPKVDRSMLIDRNALMATAYLAAAGALRDDTLARIALDDLDFLIAHARAADGSFYHAWADSGGEVPGLVADQVYMLEAMTAAYQSSGNARYLNEARGLAKLIMADFRDAGSGLLRNRAPSDKSTVLAAVNGDAEVLYDDAMPSVQATAAIALETLAGLTSERRYAEQASQLLDAAPALANADAASTLGTLGLALERREAGESAHRARGNSMTRQTARGIAVTK